MNVDSMLETDGLPANIHAEMTILGAMLVEPVAVEDALLLDAEDFLLDAHRAVFRAMRGMHDRAQPIDLITVCAALGGYGSAGLDRAGGVAYLASLSNGLPRRLAVGSYVRIVREKSMRRKGLALCDDAMKRLMGRDGDVLTELAELSAALERVADGTQPEPTLHAQGEAEFERMERQRSGAQATFVTSGLTVLDSAQGGYALGETAILAARPNVGKSTLLRQAVAANCEAGNFVHLFSLEMSAGDILRHLWAMVARIPFSMARHPERLTERDLHYLEMAKQGVAAWPLLIDESRGLAASELIGKVRRVKRLHGTKLVGVDYLQKMRFRGRAQDRHTEITDGMVALTAMAKTEDVAVVAISSLTEGEGRGKNAVPAIGNLRGSGDIQYEADSVYLLHRERDAETQQLVPETMLIVGKARSDATGSRTVYFDGAMQVFFDQEQFLRGMGK